MNKFFIAAASALALASCSSDDFLGEIQGNEQMEPPQQSTSVATQAKSHAPRRPAAKPQAFSATTL